MMAIFKSKAKIFYAAYFFLIMFPAFAFGGSKEPIESIIIDRYIQMEPNSNIFLSQDIDSYVFQIPVKDIEHKTWEPKAIERLSLTSLNPIRIRTISDLEKVFDLPNGGDAYLNMPMVFGNFVVKSGRTIVLRGDIGEKIIVFSGNVAQPIFTVEPGGVLILRNIGLTNLTPADDNIVPFVKVLHDADLVMANVTFFGGIVGLENDRGAHIYGKETVFSNTIYPLLSDGGEFIFNKCSFVNPLVMITPKNIGEAEGERPQPVAMNFQMSQWYDYHGKNPKGNISNLYLGMDQTTLISKAFVKYTNDYIDRWWLDFDEISFLSLSQSGLQWFDMSDVSQGELITMHSRLLDVLRELGIQSLEPMTENERKRILKDIQEQDSLIYYKDDAKIKEGNMRLLASTLIQPLTFMNVDIFSMRAENWWKGRIDVFSEKASQVPILYDMILPGLLEWGFFPPFLEVAENQFRINGHSVAYLISRMDVSTPWDMFGKRLDRYNAWLQELEAMKNSKAGALIWEENMELFTAIDNYVRFCYFDIPMNCVLFASLASWKLFNENKTIQKISWVRISGYDEVLKSGLVVSNLTQSLKEAFTEDGNSYPLSYEGDFFKILHNTVNRRKRLKLDM